MNGLAEDMVVLLLGLAFFGMCAFLGTIATSGSFALLAKYWMHKRQMSEEKKLMIVIIVLLSPVFMLMLVLAVSGLGLLIVPAASVFLLLAPLTALVLSLRESLRGMAWKAAVSLACLGLVLISVPAGFFVWGFMAS